MRRPFIHHLAGCLLLGLLHTQCDSCLEPSYRHRSPSSNHDDSKFKYVHNPHLKKVLQELEGGNKHNIDSQDKDGNTALMLAVKEGDDEALNRLLQHNADRNIQNKEGDTALMMLLKKGIAADETVAMVKKLANEQTDFTRKDNAGNHPLHLAMKTDNAAQRQQVWQHIMAMMQQTLAKKNMTLAELPELLSNKENKTPRNILWECHNASDAEKRAYLDAYTRLSGSLRRTTT